MKSFLRLGLVLAGFIVVSTGAVIAKSAKTTASIPPTGMPGRISIEGRRGRVKAPRDTLVYTLRWGRATNATSYRVTVTAAGTPAGTATLGLPNNLTVPDTFATFSASNLTYDSLAFAASVIAVRGTRTNPTPATKNWFIVKIPGAPGSLQVDSTAIPPPLASLDVNIIPPALNVGQFGTACAFFKFSNGLVGMRTSDATGCAATYATKYSAAQRALTCGTQDWLDGTSTCKVGSFVKAQRFAVAY